MWHEKHSGLYNLAAVIMVVTNFRLGLEVGVIMVVTNFRLGLEVGGRIFESWLIMQQCCIFILAVPLLKPGNSSDC